MKSSIKKLINKIMIKLFGNQYLFLKWKKNRKQTEHVDLKGVTIISNDLDVLKLYKDLPHFFLDLEHCDNLKKKTHGYVVFLEKNDRFDSHSFKALNDSINLGYSVITFDHCEKIIFEEPYFKPYFNIDLERSTAYIKNAFILNIDDITTINSSYSNMQELCYDLILRSFENNLSFNHIPDILLKKKKSYFELNNCLPLLEEHYKRCGIRCVEVVYQNEILVTKYHQFDKKKISIIIPNKDHIEDLERCLNSIKQNTINWNYEILIIENNSINPKTFQFYNSLKKDSRIKILYWQDEFNYSAINNYAVKNCNGEYIIFLNNDTEVISNSWLDGLIGPLQRKEVGIVGALLYYFDKTIQHCGVILGISQMAAHVYSGKSIKTRGYMDRVISQQEYSAVTAACMAIRKDTFLKVNGFTENLAVAFNDIDLCLKIISEDLLVFYNPQVKLFHYESKSRGKDDDDIKRKRYEKEFQYMRSKWGKIIDNDKNYNRNLSKSRFDFKIDGNKYE